MTKRRDRKKGYGTWDGMKQRCLNPNNSRWKEYGGRGIKVCQHWLDSFENFLKDMGEKPFGLTLDRIDNDGDYTPENCRWATPKEQQRNRADTVLITYNGDTKTLYAWADITGIKSCTLYSRYFRKWTPEKILTYPLQIKETGEKTYRAIAEREGYSKSTAYRRYKINYRRKKGQ